VGTGYFRFERFDPRFLLRALAKVCASAAWRLVRVEAFGSFLTLEA
jgi:hypothetical protein